MIRLISGGFYSEARDYAISEIKGLVLLKKRCYLIVPEQQALQTESETIGILPKDAPLYFEVSNFSRFANSAFRTLGGISREYLDRTKRTVLMWQTLKALSPVLNMTKSRREISVGMVDKAIRAVVKMQSCAITPEALCELEGDERISENGRLKSKISDLSLIMAHYRDLLRQRYNETGDDISELCSLVSENPDYLANTDIYFEGFTSFTEPQYKLIELLSARARVHVVLTIPRLFGDSVEFGEARAVRERLKRGARLANTSILEKRVDSPRSTANPVLREYCELLWQSFGTASEPTDESERETLRIFEGQSPYDAADFLAADIRRKVEGGWRYKDFAVICRDADAYSGILSSALETQGIPAFLSLGRNIESFEAIKLINAAYRVLMKDFDAGAVLSYAKCSLCGVSRGACDEFEEYIHTWQLNNSRFYDEVLWNASPRGMVAVSDGDREALLRINETRKKICEPLIYLSECEKDAKTVSERARALFDFLNKISLEEAIWAQSRELLKVSEESLAKDNLRLWKIICDSLDMLCETVGDMEISREGFLNLLSVAFSAGKVSKIPAHVDEITIGSADILRLGEKKHVYLFGVNNGEFPKKIQDNSYFTEREKLTISNAGLNLSPESEIEYSKELFSFSRAFSYATDSVTLIYTKSGADFAKSERAPVIDRLIEISGGNLKIRKISELSPLDFIHTEKSVLSSLGRLADIEYKSVFDLFSNEKERELWKIADTDIQNSSLSLSKESLSEIYEGDALLSQSRLEKYNSCPLLYFCSYNLGLKESERVKFGADSVGSFVHSILENFFLEIKEKGYDIKSLDLKMQENMVRRHAAAYINEIREGGSFIETKRAEVMIERLTKSTMPIVRGLCDEFSECDFVPSYFELGIGKGKNEISPSAITYETESGKRIRIAGIIDRVDTYEKDGDVYVRVVDYKTGQKEFSPRDLDNGENLQMFLYLKAICDTKNERFREDLGLKDGGKIIPAGVIYVKTDLSDTTVSSQDENEVMSAVLKKQSRKGMILNDPVSIGAMNKDYIPVRLTTKGEPYETSRDKLYTAEGWEEIQDKVENSVLRIFGSMESGDVSSRPNKKGKKSPCEYCPYKPICRNEGAIKG